MEDSRLVFEVILNQSITASCGGNVIYSMEWYDMLSLKGNMAVAAAKVDLILHVLSLAGIEGGKAGILARKKLLEGETKQCISLHQ